MEQIDRIAGVIFLVAGVPTVAFGVFSILGTVVGVIVAVGGLGLALSGSGSGEELLMGVVVAMAYGVWALVCLATGTLQLVAGARLLQGTRDKLTWAATIASMSTVLTVYCAPFGVLAFVAGLAAMLVDRTET